jgi:hypothetical protein
MPKRTSYQVHYSKEEYVEYLRSPEWEKLRASVLKPESLCAFCQKNKATQVHHLTYRNIVDVEKYDLRPTCDPCHAKIHKLVDAGKLFLNSKRHGGKLFALTVRALREADEHAIKPRWRVTIDRTLAERISTSPSVRFIAGILKRSCLHPEYIEGMVISAAKADKVNWFLKLNNPRFR